MVGIFLCIILSQTFTIYFQVSLNKGSLQSKFNQAKENKLECKSDCSVLAFPI